MKNKILFGLLIFISPIFLGLIDKSDKYDLSAPNGYYLTEEEYYGRKMHTDMKITDIGINCVFIDHKKTMIKPLGWFAFSFDNNDFVIHEGKYACMAVDMKGPIRILGIGPSKSGDEWGFTEILAKKEGITDEWTKKIDMEKYIGNDAELYADYKAHSTHLTSQVNYLSTKLAYLQKYNERANGKK